MQVMRGNRSLKKNFQGDFHTFLAQTVYYLEKDSRYAWVLLESNIGSYETAFGNPPFKFFFVKSIYGGRYIRKEMSVAIYIDHNH